MPNVFGREPALIVGAVNALIALAVGFGLSVTAAQVGLINAAVAAILSVVVRQSVTPVVGDESGVTLSEVCLTVIAVIFVLWAFGVVPTK